jgi:Fur family ferric uptake transcriptional regulator
MPRASSYRTKQGDTILSCLADLGDRHVTVDELAAQLEANGRRIGIATIYRHLDKLEQSGLVRRILFGNTAGAGYQFIGNVKPNCFDLMCADCGRLQRIGCESVNQFKNHILNGHEFHIDHTKTVLYGKCATCAKSE